MACCQHRNATKCHHAHATRQTVHAIQHVEGIDERNAGHHRERPGHPPQLHCPVAEQVTQRRHRETAAVNQQHGGGQVAHQPDAGGQVEAVVHHTQTDEHGRGDQQHDAVVPEVIAAQCGHRSAGENGNAADDRNFTAVLLVAAGTVEQADRGRHRPQHEQQSGASEKRGEGGQQQIQDTHPTRFIP